MKDYLHLAAVGHHINGDFLALSHNRAAVFIQNLLSLLVEQGHIYAAAVNGFAVIDNFTRGRLIQAENCASEGGFSAAGFADKSQCLSLFY